MVHLIIASFDLPNEPKMTLMIRAEVEAMKRPNCLSVSIASITRLD